MSKWHKIWGDVTARKARTALVSISILIGVFGVVTLITTRDFIFNGAYEQFSAEKIPMLAVAVALDEDVPADSVDNAAVLATLRNYPQVTDVEAWSEAPFYWQKPGEAGFVENVIWAFSETWDTLQMHPTTLVEGAYPGAGQHELAVDWITARRYDLGVGDAIVVRILGALSGDLTRAGEIPEETWTISAIVYHPYLYEYDGINIYANLDDFAHITGDDNFDTVKARFADFATAKTAADSFEALIAAQTPYRVRYHVFDDPEAPIFVDFMENWGEPIAGLGFVALLVSSFLVVTVISTIIVEQKRQIGTMKSLGASQFDNVVMYAGLAVVYGVIGTVPGVLLGVPAGYYLAANVGTLTNVLVDDFTLPYTTMLTGAALGVLMPFLAALIPVLLGTRVTILDAMTDIGISTRYGKGAIARVIRWLPLPLFLRQALANLYRKKGRLGLTGLTLTVASAAFVGVSAVFISMTGVIDEVLATFNYELSVTPLQSAAFDYDQVRALIEESADGIQAIYPAFGALAEVAPEQLIAPDDGEFTLYLSGFDTRTNSVQLNLQAGSAWENDPDRPGIVVTEHIADATGLGVGDSLALLVDGQPYELEIIGIDSFIFEGGFTHWQTVAAMSGERTPNQYWIQFSGEALTGGEVDQKLGDIRETLLRHGIVAGFQNQRALAEEQTEIFLSIGMMFNIASVLMALVGAVGLLAMLAISVFERQREIGVMRAVGARSQVIAGQFLAEGVLVGVLAWLLSLPLSYGIGAGLASILPMSEFGFDYPLIVPSIGLAGMVALAALASLWPSLAAARKTVSDILRYQ